MNKRNAHAPSAGGDVSATSSRYAEVALRIPFEFVSHLSTSKVHLLMHRNDALNIQCEVDTRYRNGKPGRSTRHFYVAEPGTKMFRSLRECLDAHPDLASKAEALYPDKLIGYYNGDEYGSDGWWEEGGTSDEIQRMAKENASASGFDCAPPLVVVDVAKLEELISDEWGDLHCQWRLARRNNWVSSAVDAAIKAEETRRDEN